MEFVNEPSELSEEAALDPGDRSSAQMRENDTDPRANNPVPGEQPGTAHSNGTSANRLASFDTSPRRGVHFKRDGDEFHFRWGTVGQYTTHGIS